MAETGRVVLEGVDRYQVMDPLFEGVRVVLSYRGERYSPAYVQGISGAAFRIGGICPCAPTCTAAMETQALPRLFGYEVEHVPLAQEGAELEAAGRKVVARVKDEIRAGRPVVLWHAFTMAEFDVVAGFDEAPGEFLGRGSYLGLEAYATAPQMRTTTSGEICPSLGAIFIGEKTGTFDARQAEMAALREAVTHARTTKDPVTPDGKWGFLEGIQCYDRWVNDLETQGPLAVTHGAKYCLGVYRTTHRAASGFIAELAQTYSAAREPLSRAAACFAEEADALDASLPFIGWEAPQEVDPAWYAQATALVAQARDAYARGIDGIEAALPLMG